MNILSAHFANEAGTAVALMTDVSGAVALDLSIEGRNHLVGMAAYAAWIEAGNAPDAYQAPPPPPPTRDIPAELDEAKATIAALLKSGTLTRAQIDAELAK